MAQNLDWQLQNCQNKTLDNWPKCVENDLNRSVCSLTHIPTKLLFGPSVNYSLKLELSQ